jgi:hypothetical protein
MGRFVISHGTSPNRAVATYSLYRRFYCRFGPRGLLLSLRALLVLGDDGLEEHDEEPRLTTTTRSRCRIGENRPASCRRRRARVPKPPD